MDDFRIRVVFFNSKRGLSRPRFPGPLLSRPGGVRCPSAHPPQRLQAQQAPPWASGCGPLAVTAPGLVGGPPTGPPAFVHLSSTPKGTAPTFPPLPNACLTRDCHFNSGPEIPSRAALVFCLIPAQWFVLSNKTSLSTVCVVRPVLPPPTQGLRPARPAWELEDPGLLLQSKPGTPGDVHSLNSLRAEQRKELRWWNHFATCQKADTAHRLVLHLVAYGFRYFHYLLKCQTQAQPA